MNVKNNKRKRDSMERITKVFLELLQTKEVHEITVTDICKQAGVNRATFYANYLDIYDLRDKTLDNLRGMVDDLYQDEVTKGYNSNDYLRLLRHISENQLYYKTCFKLGIGELPITQYDPTDAEKYGRSKNVLYHMEFFRGGFNRMVKIWLDGGCRESPEEMEEVLRTEYLGITE